MSVPAYVAATASFGYKTATAGTAIVVNIPGVTGYKASIIDYRYTAAATAHIGSFMFANGTGSRNTNSALAAAGQAHIITSVAPKDPAGNAAAANDYIAYQVADGSWEFNTVASLSGSDLTLNTNLAQACPSGAMVMVFGVVGDLSRFDINNAASGQTKMGEGRLAIVHKYKGEPFMFYSPNATNAGSVDNILVAYIDR